MTSDYLTKQIVDPVPGYVLVPSLLAVVVWQSVSLVNKYKNPNTIFTVSVSACSVGRFESVATSRFRLAFSIIHTWYTKLCI